MKLIARQISILSSGNLFAQGLTFAALPLITRLYTAADFGLLAVSLSFMGFTSVFLCMRYDQAIPLALSRAMISATLILSFFIATVLSLLAFGIGVWLLPLLGYKLPNNFPFGLAIIGSYAFALYNLIIIWATRYGLLWYCAWGRVLSASTQITAKLGFGIVAASGTSLVLGEIIGLTVSIIVLGWFVFKCQPPRLHAATFFPRIKLAACTNLPFLKYGTAETMLTTFGNQIPVVLVGLVFGAYQAGILFVALQLSRAPVTLLSNAVGRAYMSGLAKNVQEGTIDQHTHEYLSFQIRFAVPFVVGYGALAAVLAGPVLGENYGSAEHAILWFVPWIALIMISSPFYPVLYASNRFGLALVISVFGAVVKTGSVFLAAYFGMEIFAPLAMANVAFYVVVFVTIARVSGIVTSALLSDVVRAVPLLTLVLVIAGVLYHLKTIFQ